MSAPDAAPGSHTAGAGPEASAAASGADHRPNPALGLAKLVAAAAAYGKADDAAAAAAGGAGEAAAAGSSPAAASLDFRRPGAHDSHPFFSYYGLLVHQQNMMQDAVRTGAYAAAIADNAADFAGKTVLDVGTGSGILAVFAARAGAAHVYAVEASGVAERAAALMAANGLADRITVIKAKIEEVRLPEDARVDVIISEPMGFMLVHERMLESYMIARQRFLKPGGKMFPTTGTIFAAPFTDASEWLRARSRARARGRTHTHTHTHSQVAAEL
jgi:histone-arginine methyltransferase CARM1